MKKDMFETYEYLRGLYYAVCKDDKPKTEEGFRQACTRVKTFCHELIGMLELLKEAEIITEEEAFRQREHLIDQFNTVYLYHAYVEDDATVTVFYHPDRNEEEGTK